MLIVACTATDSWTLTWATEGGKIGRRARTCLSATPGTTTQMISTTSFRVDRNVGATRVNVYCSVARVNVDDQVTLTGVY